MRILQFECDNKCGEKTENTDDDQFPRHWVTIGSEKGDAFLFRNYLQNTCKKEMNRYSNLHFCSIKCFAEYFFHKGFDSE